LNLPAFRQVFTTSAFLGLQNANCISCDLWQIYCHPQLSEPIFFIIIHLLTCAYIVWVISSPCPSSPASPSSPLPNQAEPVLPLSLILLKRRHKHNKEDKAFLLVKDSYTERFLALLSCTNVSQPKLIHL
jgi:hypothetical protein